MLVVDDVELFHFHSCIVLMVFTLTCFSILVSVNVYKRKLLHKICFETLFYIIPRGVVVGLVHVGLTVRVAAEERFIVDLCAFLCFQFRVRDLLSISAPEQT